MIFLYIRFGPSYKILILVIKLYDSLATNFIVTFCTSYFIKVFVYLFEYRKQNVSVPFEDIK